jgi:hypothetical protein
VPAGGSLELAPLVTNPPQVQIAYNPPPSIAISSPADSATYIQGQALSAVYSCRAGEGTGLKACAGPVVNGAVVDTATLGPHTFTVNAEDSDRGKSAQSVTYTVVVAPPDTILDSHPKKTIKTTKAKVKIKFSFSSDPAGTTFECKLDKGVFALCTSPRTYKVKPGKHTFSAQAVSPGGTDPTPASFSFKVKKDH